MPTDAIPPDVSKGGIPDLNDPSVVLSRGAKMAAMSARRRETVEAELEPHELDALRASREGATASPLGTPDAPAIPAVIDEDTDAGDAIATAARASLEADAARAPQATPAAPPSQLDRQREDDTVLAGEDLTRMMVRTKVNGVEVMRSVAEVIANAQKVDAADQYLEKAKRTLAEVDQVAADVKARAAQPNSAATSSPSTPSTEGPDPIDAAIDSLFQGDEAKAKKLLREAIGQRSTAAPTQPVDQIASQVEQQLVIRSAVRQFAKDHREIVNNPKLREVANGFIADELRSRGVNRLDELDAATIPEVYEAAGRSTRDLFRSAAGLAPAAPASAPQAPKVDLSAARRENKRAIDEPASAHTRTTSSVPPPKTTTDVINSMRAARGQLVQP